MKHRSWLHELVWTALKKRGKSHRWLLRKLGWPGQGGDYQRLHRDYGLSTFAKVCRVLKITVKIDDDD